MFKNQMRNQIFLCCALVAIATSVQLIHGATEFDIINKTGQSVNYSSLEQVSKTKAWIPSEARHISKDQPIGSSIANEESLKFAFNKIYEFARQNPTSMREVEESELPLLKLERELKSLEISFPSSLLKYPIDLERIKSLPCKTAIVILKAGTWYGFKIDYLCPESYVEPEMIKRTLLQRLPREIREELLGYIKKSVEREN